MLGMYIHTHWGYNRPWAARAWSVRDWRAYLSGLAALGYRFIMVWPQFDAMPPEPNRSDRLFLQTLSEAIDIAHADFGMRVALCAAGNTIGNDRAALYEFPVRPYFFCEERIDPGDAEAVAAFQAGRERQFSFITNADALAIIDSDPGGYIGSTNDAFVRLMHGQITAFRKHNPSAELIYWMLAGWENYNKFWEGQLSDRDERTQMWDNLQGDDFVDTLTFMRDTVSEPWSLYAWLDEHLDAASSLGLSDRIMYYPYGTVEKEPSFPLTNYDPGTIAEVLSPGNLAKGPRGVLANAQTHCLQLPNTCIFAHFARDGTLENLDLASFAEDLLPGHGAPIARGWEAIGNPDPDEQRAAAEQIRGLTGGVHRTGRCAGLLFEDLDRFLTDLAMNLELRAVLIEMKRAIDMSSGEAAAVRHVLSHLRPYQERLGFVDAYGGPLHAAFNQELARLGVAGIDERLACFSDWRDPGVRHNIVPELLDAVADWCGYNPEKEAKPR